MARKNQTNYYKLRAKTSRYFAEIFVTVLLVILVFLIILLIIH